MGVVVSVMQVVSSWVGVAVMAGKGDLRNATTALNVSVRPRMLLL